jgi:hypothetical protein
MAHVLLCLRVASRKLRWSARVPRHASVRRGSSTTPNRLDGGRLGFPTACPQSIDIRQSLVSGIAAEHARVCAMLREANWSRFNSSRTRQHADDRKIPRSQTETARCRQRSHRNRTGGLTNMPSPAVPNAHCFREGHLTGTIPQRRLVGDLHVRVQECVFGVLALESEPVDPRL